MGQSHKSRNTSERPVNGRDWGLFIIAVVVVAICFVGYRLTAHSDTDKRFPKPISHSAPAFTGIELVSTGTNFASLKGIVTDSGQPVGRNIDQEDIALWARFRFTISFFHNPIFEFRIRDESNLEYPNYLEWRGAEAFVLIPKGYAQLPRALTASLVRQGKVVWTCPLPQLPIPVRSRGPLPERIWPDLSIHELSRFGTNEAYALSIRNTEKFLIGAKIPPGHALLVRTVGSSSCAHEPSDEAPHLYRSQMLVTGDQPKFEASLNYPRSTPYLYFEVTERELVHHRIHLRFPIKARGKLLGLKSLGKSMATCDERPDLQFFLDSYILRPIVQPSSSTSDPGKNHAGNQLSNGQVEMSFGLDRTPTRLSLKPTESASMFGTLLDRIQTLTCSPKVLDGTEVQYSLSYSGVTLGSSTPPTIVRHSTGKVGDPVLIDMDYTSYDKVVRTARFSVKCSTDR